MKNGNVNILIVDDHPFIRNAIADMLSHKGKYKVFTAESGYEAIAYADEYPLDMIIMDIVMPEKDGIQTTTELKDKYPDLKVLMLTGAYTHECIFEIIKTDAEGCILKDAKEEEMNIAVKKILQGEYYFGSKPIKDILADFKDIILPRKLNHDNGREQLTKREKQIVMYIAQGFVNKDIARKLFVSQRTVDKHRTNILKKLQVNNSAELIAHAMKYGMIE